MDYFDSLAFKKMSKHYESLLESGNMSDVVLVVGGKELRAHKLILSARSPVFAAMFAHPSTKEAQENRAEIIDVDVEVVELLVRYIYTGKVGTLGGNAADLLIAADKYQMDGLKSICMQKLSFQINTESVCDLLLFADLYQATELNTDDLEYDCIDFIIWNATEVMTTESWKKVAVRADLMGKLFEYLYSKYSNLVNDKKMVMESKKMEQDMDCNTLGQNLDFEKYLLQYSNVFNWEEEMTDGVLIVGDSELNVHKVILSDRSPIFATMFAHASTNEDNRMQITDIDVDVLKVLIMYIYTGKVEGLDRNAEKLLIAADLYQVDGLKSICEQQLSSHFSTESVSNLLILADTYQSTELTTKCVEYIIDNVTQVMQQEQDWKKIVARADLVALLFEHLHLKYSKAMDDNLSSDSDSYSDYDYQDDYVDTDYDDNSDFD